MKRFLKKIGAILAGGLLIVSTVLPLDKVVAKAAKPPKNGELSRQQSESEIDSKVNERLEKLALAHSYSMFATGQATGDTLCLSF